MTRTRCFCCDHFGKIGNCCVRLFFSRFWSICFSFSHFFFRPHLPIATQKRLPPSQSRARCCCVASVFSAFLVNLPGKTFEILKKVATRSWLLAWRLEKVTSQRCLHNAYLAYTTEKLAITAKV